MKWYWRISFRSPLAGGHARLVFKYPAEIPGILISCGRGYEFDIDFFFKEFFCLLYAQTGEVLQGRAAKLLFEHAVYIGRRIAELF